MRQQRRPGLASGRRSPDALPGGRWS